MLTDHELLEAAQSSSNEAKPTDRVSNMNINELSAILVSRICHDLVSPVGAVVNGIDLIRDIGTGNVDAELQMVAQSANRASALLQFYRVAFGATGEDAEISRNCGTEPAATQQVSPSRSFKISTSAGFQTAISLRSFSARNQSRNASAP